MTESLVAACVPSIDCEGGYKQKKQQLIREKGPQTGMERIFD